MLSTQQGPAAVPAVLAQLVQQVRSLATAEARHLLNASTPAERAGWVVGLQQLTDAVAAKLSWPHSKQLDRATP